MLRVESIGKVTALPAERGSGLWGKRDSHLAKQGRCPAPAVPGAEEAVPGGPWQDGSLTCREEVLLTGSGIGVRRLGGFFL